MSSRPLTAAVRPHPSAAPGSSPPSPPPTSPGAHPAGNAPRSVRRTAGVAVGRGRGQGERPEEYAQLIKDGTLASYFAPPPSERRRTIAVAFGFFALSVGTLLGIFLIIAG